LSPELDLVVRANKDKDIELLYQLGAREVVQPEFEASLQLATHLLIGMGLSVPAVQQEVQQIRSHHYLELRPTLPASQIARDLQLAALDLNSRWYRLPPGSPLTGMTLEEADLRYLTGVSLIAIRRSKGEEIDYPDPQTILKEGDRLLVVGEAEEVAAFDELAKGKAAIPEENMPCHWVTVPADSPVVGQAFSKLDIHHRCGVQVKALRRDGKFLRFPERKINLQTRDQLLLCGGFPQLHQLQQWLAPTTQSKALPSVPVVETVETEGMQELSG
jgi:CPA2 family monovalent cation:H+ antiporter-2